MTTPQQGSIGAESKTLAQTDFGEPDLRAGEDHAAHAPGRTCVACGQVIKPEQDARRRGEADWAHDVCPASR